ncbi:MAG: nucleotidyltransferase family protein [Flavobacterium sp.]|nr:nucleotidyltransferase family protein [Pedobacter sp.]
MSNSQPYVVNFNQEARVALRSLDILPDNVSRTLFVMNDSEQIVGSLTDGDIRRGLLNGLEISHSIASFMNTSFKYLKNSNDNLDLIKSFRKADLNLIPLLDDQYRLLELLDLKRTITMIPVAALIMAGGRGERLRPLTDFQPKPMLKIGEKPIIEHNIDRLIFYGIKDIFISVKYLKEQIINYLGDGSSKGINIHYIEETEALGTLGALSLIDEVNYEDILIMNSDILTNIDIEDFYRFFKEHNASMALASIPYQVNIPYAVLETVEHFVTAFKEKPSYTYYSNGGIYLMKFELKRLLAKGCFFNATDMMDLIIAEKNQIMVHYPLLGYWLDIGKYSDYTKAQEDIRHIKL